MAGVATADFKTVFASRGPLARVEAPVRARFLDAARPLTVARGARVCSPGDDPGGIFGVVSGGIGVEAGSPHLGPRLGHVVRNGHWFGEGPALWGGERRMGYRALEDSQLALVTLAALQALQRDDPDIIRLLVKIMEIGGQVAVQAARELLIPDGPRRIVAVLLRVTGVHEGIEPTSPQGYLLTQQDLGEMANASRHYVNRVLSTVEARGWIAKSYNHIRLLDVPALTAFAIDEG